MVSLPPSHPLSKHIRVAARNRKRHKSPLHRHDAFRNDANDMETINPARHLPKWSPKLKVTIHDDPLDAIVHDIQAETDNDICLYSDGSGYEGNIGGAAVLKRGGVTKKTLTFHLGSDKEHTVDEGEEVGMILAAELIRNERHARKISLGVDSKAAIQAARSSKAGPGHYLMDLFHETLASALKTVEAKEITIQWTPGHVGIPGNEEADVEAKEAARGTTSNPTLLPNTLKRGNAKLTLPTNKSAAARGFADSTKSLQKKIFDASPQAAPMKRLDPSMPSKQYLKLVGDLPKCHAAILFQLRTGHVPLNKHLHHIQKSDTPKCTHCPGRDETILHYLLECPKYDKQRKRLKRVLHRKARNIASLLADPNCTKETLAYIHATQRFKTTHGDLTPPPEKDK